MTRNLCREFEKDIAKNIKSDPKAFWRYTNSKLKSRPNLGDLVDEDGKLTSDDNKKAELLNNFTSVFTQEDTSKIPKLDTIHTGTPLTHIEITSEKVNKKLLKLNVTKSSGPDEFHLRILRETASSICLPLTTIYTKSMTEGEVPSTWKEGNIIPIHQKGNKTAVGNYRPVSLTSVVGRLMETLVRDQIVSHMMENGLFCDEQHGFVPGRSCMTQLVITIELWTELLDTGAPLDVS